MRIKDTKGTSLIKMIEVSKTWQRGQTKETVIQADRETDYNVHRALLNIIDPFTDQLSKHFPSDR